MVVNRQRRVGVDLASLRDYVARLQSELGLGRRDFNVCLAGDREIERLNTVYRRKRHPTDVLSFPWLASEGPDGPASWSASRALPDRARREFAGFLGDIVISAETARRNARAAGHSTAREIRRLTLHGVLHLMGYDHETDAGEMTTLELELQRRLGL